MAEDLIKLEHRKRSIEERLSRLGINKYQITYLGYLDMSEVAFRSPYEVGCRLLIFYGLAYSVHHLKDRPKVVDWFKREGLWEHVSPNEQSFLNNPKPEERELQDLSWHLEGALTLGWVLGLVDSLHDVDRDETGEEMQAFTDAIPELGAPVKEFLTGLSYRNLEEVYDENLVNELVTSFFRDMYFSGAKDQTVINRMASYERHRALNWVRRFSEEEDWDDTDTST